ncbi:recombination-associated protein RdgC [Algicola sagamiensis]|uniref:recombination-associated protein RdgC n=1 Tax=Algicola sagamiensis TaxID=163869 RepID=UPI00036A96B9|nr:recombination-associated protein RdgC [Algicola sagamiensis]
MWFSNLRVYRFTQPFSLDLDNIEEQLQENAFQPCGSTELAKMGWSAPLGKGSEALHHAGHGHSLFCLKKEEKLLPSAVINDYLAEKIELVEHEQQRPVRGKEKQALKEEIVHSLLPRAFSKYSYLHGFVSPDKGWVVVNASAAGKAEEFLALLRKSLGSFPVKPAFTEVDLRTQMTHWLENDAPDPFELGSEVELQAPEEDGAQAKLKQQELSSEEIRTLLEHHKQVIKIALERDERLSFLLCDDGAIKRLKFADQIKEANEDITDEDRLARLDADFVLQAAEICELLDLLADALGEEDIRD